MDKITPESRLKNAKTANSFHPFFCNIKRVRKTAWDTPEYLSDEDWALAEAACLVAASDDLLALVYQSDANSEAFFWRLIGWPEGRCYMRSAEYARATGWPALAGHELKKLAAVTRARKGNLTSSSA